MTTQKAARASPELRKAPLSPRYSRNYTTPRGTTLDWQGLQVSSLEILRNSATNVPEYVAASNKKLWQTTELL